MTRQKKFIITITVIFILLITCITGFASSADDTEVMPLGYENSTCHISKFYHKSTYSETNTLHGVSLTCSRTAKKVTTSMPTASVTSCYVVSSVYKNNGTLTGVHYNTDVARPTFLSNTVTATSSTPTTLDVRSADHYGYQPGVCSNGEHIYYYYDASHPSDPQ